jgi:hypothetical protein
MNTSESKIVSVIKQIIAILLFRPSVSIILSLPSAFLLFAPKEYTDLFLNNANISEKLNPWIGLVCLYFGTGIIVYVLNIIRKILFHRLIWWYRRNYDQ